ncbi:hypothetical protein [Caballeronia sp. J97]|uniref:hypothetical protein n=1 Tax=Caballeronia sp. J97 TaxID=2805429 RepID=UPI002AB2BCCE|nr:hypothetical protein [Caballeronia sp. J97]
MSLNSDKNLNDVDAGLAALVVIARFHGIAADAVQLKHVVAAGTEWLSENDLVRSARHWPQGEDRFVWS